MVAAVASSSFDSGVASVCVVLQCEETRVRKVRYVFDTLLMAAGIAVTYSELPPANGVWILYASAKNPKFAPELCVAIAHCPEAWGLFDGDRDVEVSHSADGLPIVLPGLGDGFVQPAVDIAFDIIANAFYFLSSWSERLSAKHGGGRQLYANSIQRRLGIPLDIVDRYLEELIAALSAAVDRAGQGRVSSPEPWPAGGEFAVVLSHDVDFVPGGIADIAKQGAKSVLRHLLRERNIPDALRAARGLLAAGLAQRDPYGCIPDLIERETALGVQASFQVAVGHRHPSDVNYYIENDTTRDYLKQITDAGFELCLHGSYRSTEKSEWYADEVALLTTRLSCPAGSRQHFLSFDYDALFAAQEAAGIQYDMSMGFPDQVGPRAGFSFPYFPYCLKEDRPYNVVQISLFLMDVTMRGYLNLKLEDAENLINQTLQGLRRKGGCVSVVWHPILFGGARDPGYDTLFWNLIRETRSNNGWPTDGRSVNHRWRDHSARYASFSNYAVQQAC